MDQNEYRTLKETGGLPTDAASEEEVTDQQPEDVVVEEQDTDPVEETQEEEEDDLPPLSEKEKTAFDKRMERERKKERERLEAEYEQKFGRHKQVIDLLGGDPDAIEKRIRDNQLAQEANRIAEANGWDEEQTTWYIEQQKQQRELKELRVQMEINRLRDNPDYGGIGTMEKEILAKIEQTNGALNVQEAYWALGGSKKAEQIKLEAQMREQAKRAKQPRTVLTDTAVSHTAEKPLPADILRDAERMGVSAAEARRLYSLQPAGNIDEWRARNKK